MSKQSINELNNKYKGFVGDTAYNNRNVTIKNMPRAKINKIISKIKTPIP